MEQIEITSWVKTEIPGLPKDFEILFGPTFYNPEDFVIRKRVSCLANGYMFELGEINPEVQQDTAALEGNEKAERDSLNKIKEMVLAKKSQFPVRMENQ